MKTIELKSYGLLTGGKEADIVKCKIGWKCPIGLGAEDELQRGINPRLFWKDVPWQSNI